MDITTRERIHNLRMNGGRQLAAAAYLEKQAEVKALYAANDLPSAEYEDRELIIMWHDSFNKYGEAFAEEVAE